MNTMDCICREPYHMSRVPLHEPVKAIHNSVDFQAFGKATKHSGFDDTVNAGSRSAAY